MNRPVQSAPLVLVSHHLCPYVQRAAIALLEKGVPFERVNVDLANKPEWFLALSPLGKAPLLRVGDDVLFESSVLCEYVEDTTSPPMHPSDPVLRAKHRGWMEFASSALEDIWGLETAKEEAVFLRKRDQLAAKLQRVEAMLGEGPYFAGPSFSFVDAAFAPVFRYFEVFDAIVDLGVFDGLPRVRAWRAALAERPSVKAAVGSDYGERLRRFLVQEAGYLNEVPRLLRSLVNRASSRL